MALETTKKVGEGEPNRPDPGPIPDRRTVVAKPGKRSGGTPWQFDTRVALARAASGAPKPAPSIDEVARSYLGLCNREGHLDPSSFDRWNRTMADQGGAAGLFRELHRVDPAEALRIARGVTSLPEPGEDFLGFRIIGEIGRGAFGRVYLAQQGDLADRHVALKVSTELRGESQTLAQLQHTNIVPIFSVHHAEPFQAVCMPFYGTTTLKDVCDDLEQAGEAPASGRSILKTLSTKKSPSRPGESAIPTARSLPMILTPGRDSKPSIEDVTNSDDRASLSTDSPRSKTLRMIGELPYDEAVLWMGSRLADGLAHAHDRGILHRDLKPANILLTDDGQPMLLDFNLSQQTRTDGSASAASVGGTLPYMAPEHLAAFRGENRAVDERSDLYALGIILFELLARRHPFPDHEDSSPATLDKMIAERQGPPPRIKPWDDRVSPAAESIIRHCLEPDPACRYQSVRDLHEDLERHLANLPLKHAPEPSIRERARKMLRRNPRLGMWIGIGIALLGLTSTSTAMARRGHRLAQLDANETFAAFRDDFSDARYVLIAQSSDRSERDRGYDLGRKALGRYGLPKNPDWARSSAVANLAPIDREAVRGEVGEALVILAEAAADDAADRPDPVDRSKRAREGMALTELAMACFDEDKIPRSLRGRRAELMNLLGQKVDAQILMVRAEQTPLRTANDFLLAATDHLIKGETEKALPLATEASRRDPRSFWAWFAMGVCLDRLERPSQAISCFQTCIALRPENAFAWFNRGVCSLRDGKPAQALADLDRAVELKPGWAEPYLNRGLARRDLGEFPKAVNDFTKALDHGATQTRVYFLRATARANAGDLEGAKKDREAGLVRAPTDAASSIARGYERVAADPAGALADFETALTLDPRSLQALYMKAEILGVHFDRIDEAALVLDRLLRLYPDHVPSLGFRGVIHARRNRRAEALKDAEEAKWRDHSPQNLYQLAGIYALTSRQAPDDRFEAYLLLHAALRQGVGFEYLANDPELAPIRDQPEFRRLVDSARLARGDQPQAAPKP